MKRFLSNLESLPSELLENILKYLGVGDKKNLRRVNKCLLRRLKILERRLFKYLRFNSLSAKRLMLLADQVQIIKGRYRD